MQNSKIIIFDFNRTLYDPVNKKIFTGVEGMLGEIRNLGFKLFLVSQDRDGQRGEVVKKSNILHFFDKVFILPEKNLECFKGVIEENTNIKDSFVVGDYIRQEIIFGNILGFNTIWIKDGVLADNFPKEESENPNFTVSSIGEVLGIIKRHIF
jgi:FMN phosphatase YigB (HAD superfamily)